MSYAMQEYKAIATRLQYVPAGTVARISGHAWGIVTDVKKQRRLVTPDQLRDIRQALDRMGK